VSDGEPVTSDGDGGDDDGGGGDDGEGGDGGGGGDDEDSEDEEDDDDDFTDVAPTWPAVAFTAVRATLTTAEKAAARTIKAFIKFWVTRDPSKTGRLVFFTLAGSGLIFGAVVLGPQNPLEFGR